MNILRRPAPYAWLVMLGLLGSVVALLVVSLVVNKRAIERERAARIASERAAEQSRIALCGIYILLDDAYRQRHPAPGTTDAELAVAVAKARVDNRCTPAARPGK